MEPIVNTTSGPVRGLRRDGIAVYRSIPYAAPPIGARRFRPPVPVEPWTDLFEATTFGPVAAQLPSPLESMLGAPPPVCDEAQALTLSIFTPEPDTAKRPVMFWIHGGAFVNGSGASPIYDGRRFAQHGDVVVVSINYRLGAFGFLHLDEIFGPEFTGSGNAGVLDQVCALQWVRDNIESFGGDPARVTIFGQSAGGMSVGTLLGMPAAQGLFAQAIVQSGGSSFCLPSDRATETARTVLKEAGVETVADLESVSMDAILEGQTAIFAAGLRSDLPFQPVVDGIVLPSRPIDAVRAGLGQVPTMIGTTKDEMTMFTALDLGTGTIDDSVITGVLAESFGDRGPEVEAAYRTLFSDSDATDRITAIATDRVFRTPALRLAEAAPMRPTHMYLFSWESPVFDGKLKSCHALDLPFVWDAIDKPGLTMLTGDGPHRQVVADAMHHAWIAFARTGDPGWTPYEPEARWTQNFNTESELVSDPMREQRLLWAEVS